MQLYSYGVTVSDHLISWMKELLCNKSRSVCIDKMQSAFLSVTSDVPQRNVLAPLSFNIFINDPPKCCNFSNSSCDFYL